MAGFSRMGLQFALACLATATLAPALMAQGVPLNAGVPVDAGVPMNVGEPINVGVPINPAPTDVGVRMNPGVPINASNPPSSTMSAAYRVNSGDELGIYVWGEERLQSDVKVLPDGTFAFPLVGQVQAQGRLPRELEAIITERLREQYRGQVPQVTVSVKAATGLQFSVIGRVKAPGSFFPGRYINVLEALSMAGGPTEFASLNDVVVLRKSGPEVRTIRTRLGPLFRKGASAGDLARSNIITLETGDTVIVP